MQREQRLIKISTGTSGWAFTEVGTTPIHFEFDTYGIVVDERAQQCEVFVSGDIVQLNLCDVKNV